MESEIRNPSTDFTESRDPVGHSVGHTFSHLWTSDHLSDGVDVARVFEANSRALDKKLCTLVEKSAALSERSRTRYAGISGGSGHFTADGGVFVAQPPSESIKISDTPIRLTMRGIALLPGRDKRLPGDCFFSTKFLLKKLGAGRVVLAQLGDVAPVQSGGDLVAAQETRDGSDRHGPYFQPNRHTHHLPCYTYRCPLRQTV